VENRFLKKIENSKIKTAKRIQNVKDAAQGQNDYRMSGLLSNATFIDKPVYHFGCITKYLLTRTLVPPKSPLQFGWEKGRITPSCLLSRLNVI
jgi:hypothetical protein